MIKWKENYERKFRMKDTTVYIHINKECITVTATDVPQRVMEGLADELVSGGYARSADADAGDVHLNGFDPWMCALAPLRNAVAEYLEDNNYDVSFID